MNNPLKILYSEIIRKNSEAPFHFEKIKDSPVTIKAYNPVCGDKFDLYVNDLGGKINSVHFHGFGCAISKASASILAKSVEGKTMQEAIRVCESFLHSMNKESGDNELILQEDFKAFSGVHDFPERKECATLSWNEMLKFLRSK